MRIHTEQSDCKLHNSLMEPWTEVKKESSLQDPRRTSTFALCTTFLRKAMKPANTFGQALFKLKDIADNSKTVDVICKIMCKNCPVSFIVETFKSTRKKRGRHLLCPLPDTERS